MVGQVLLDVARSAKEVAAKAGCCAKQRRHQEHGCDARAGACAHQRGKQCRYGSVRLERRSKDAFRQGTCQEVAQRLDAIAKHAVDGKDTPLERGRDFALPDSAVGTADERNEEGCQPGGNQPNGERPAQGKECVAQQEREGTEAKDRVDLAPG